MRRVFEMSGCTVLMQGRVVNTLSLAYLTQLLPLPARIRPLVHRTIRATPLGRLNVRVPLGNQYLIALRPR
jgi:hypothetical protein